MKLKRDNKKGDQVYSGDLIKRIADKVILNLHEIELRNFRSF